MYIPTAFRQPDHDKLFDFIRQNSFGLIVSQAENELIASHLPFLVDRTSGAEGRLVGHFALANPQWRQADGQNVLAIFSGPHAYISPTWYEDENAVPTWNYVAVHVYGKLRIVQDEETLVTILRDFVTHYESSQPQPWKFDTTSDYAKKVMKAVAGFHIDISRIEGIWKLNQNRPAEQRVRVARTLLGHSDENSQAISQLMQEP